MLIFIREHCQANHALTVSVKNSIVIHKHPSPKIRFALSLNFDVDQNPNLTPIAQVNFDQLIRQPLPQLSLDSNLLQFLVKKFKAPRPVNLGINIAVEKPHKRRKKLRQHFFPRRIIFRLLINFRFPLSCHHSPTLALF